MQHSLTKTPRAGQGRGSSKTSQGSGNSFEVSRMSRRLPYKRK